MSLRLMAFLPLTHAPRRSPRRRTTRQARCCHGWYCHGGFPACLFPAQPLIPGFLLLFFLASFCGRPKNNQQAKKDVAREDLGTPCWSRRVVGFMLGRPLNIKVACCFLTCAQLQWGVAHRNRTSVRGSVNIGRGSTRR